MADRRASRAVLASGLVLALVYFRLPTGWPQAVVYLTLACLAPALVVLRLRRERLVRCRPWSYLTAGLGLYTVAIVVWQLLPLLTGRPLPFPSPLDASFFGAYLLYAAFLWAVLRRRYGADDPRGRALPLVDAGIFACAGIALLWPLLFTSSLGGAGVERFPLLVAAVYPVLTAVLFGLAVQVLTAGRRPGGEELLLAVWVGGELVGVTFYGVVSAAGEFHFAHPMVSSWLVSYVALAAAALHPGLTTRRGAAGGLTTQRWWSWLLLPVVLVPVPVGLLISGPTGLDPLTRGVLVALLSTGVTLVFARLHLVSGDLAEQRRLAAELADTTEQLHHLARHDPLTGLGNRRMLMERLDRAVRQRPLHVGARTGLLLLDLDGFKAINDTLGHDCGDDVLVGVAERLTTVLRPGDTLARLGGDEFAVVLEQVDAAAAASVAVRVVEVLGTPMTVTRGVEVMVRASVGIALAAPTVEPGEALREADLAMYAAKDLGGDRFSFFDARMQATMDLAIRSGRADRLGSPVVGGH